MKKFTTILATACLLTAGLVSCQKEDDDITILSTVAGDYIGKETCAPSPAGAPYHITIYNTAANDGKVFIDNIYDIHNKLTADVSGNNITVPSQPYTYVVGTGSTAVTYKGNLSATGTVNDGVLDLKFKLDGGLADECVFVGDRDARN